MRNILSIVNLVLIVLLASYFFFKNKQQEKKSYVVNQRIFDEFKGKKMLEQKLLDLQKEQRGAVDSLANLAETNVNNPLFRQQYEENLRAFQLESQELSEKYTADIWKRINGYIKEYGDKNGHTFIFGATGDGNLMYASDATNITDEVVEYINKRYEGEK